MIKFESNMLVLDNAFSEEDVHEIGAYADYVRSQERERIIELLKKEFGEEYYDMGVVGRIVALIKGDVTWSEEVTEMKQEWPDV
jgi:hypothetical protein